MDPICGCDGKIRSLDGAEDVHDPADCLEGFVKDFGADVGEVTVLGPQDCNTLCDRLDVASPTHHSRSAAT